MRLMRRVDVILALLLILGGIGLAWRSTSGGGEAANTATSRFETTEIPLQELITEQGIDFGDQNVTINGPFQLNDSFVVAPSLQPSNATAGQIYYDQVSNILNYYNGTEFVPLAGSTTETSSVQSVGTGLVLNNGQLNNTGVLSLQGQTGNVTLTAGDGIGITGTTITNNGVVSLVSGNETLIITDQGNGNLVLTVDIGGAGVTSLNGQAGVLSLANASGAGGTITIDDASTAAKGIAQFNGTNFQVAAGVVNTIQNINTGATPSFAGVNTNNITPSAALTIGSTNQALTLQGNASTQITATGGGFTTTLNFAGTPTGNVTYTLDRAAAAGTYTICTTVGNCTSGGVSTSGGTNNRVAKFTGAQTIADSSISDDGVNVATSSDLIIQGGDVTIGVINTQTGTINLAHSGSGFLGSFVQGALSANRTYLLPDAGGTVCLSTGNCSGSGSANTLQAAYDAGNTISTSDARNVAITMSDTATDSNFLVNLECDTACGANGRFAIQDDAVDVFTVSPAGGAVNFINASNSTQAFNVENSSGSNLFTIDTVNLRVGINLGGNNVPSINGDGLEVNGGIKISGSGLHTFLTPLGSGVDADLSVTTQTVGDFDQVVALGLSSTSAATSRGILVADARSVSHQPSIAVLSPNENEVAGFSWEGTSNNFYIKNSNSSIGAIRQMIGSTNIFSVQGTGADVNGTFGISSLGTADTTTYLCRNSANVVSTCSATGSAGAAFVQGGNSFGQAATLGTNDGFGLNFEVNTTTVMTISTAGAVNLQNQSNSVNAFRIQNAAASATILNADTTNQRVGIGGEASFSKFEVIGGDAAVYNSGANPRLILGDSTVAGQNGYLQWDSTNDYFRIESVGTNGLKINDNFLTIGNIFPDQPLKIANGTTLLAQVNTTGEAFFQNSTNSSNAFRVLNAAGGEIFEVDTVANTVRLSGTNTGLEILASTAEPSAPPVGTLFLYTKDIAGRTLFKMRGSTDTAKAFQTSFFTGAPRYIVPQSSTSFSEAGLGTQFNCNIGGGVSIPTAATTNLRTSSKRAELASDTIADSAACIRGPNTNSLYFWRGNAAGLGGFFYSQRFAVATTTTNQRLYAGLWDRITNPAGNLSPSSQTNIIGAGWDSADTNLQIMHNDSAGAATKVDLGASFPANNTTAIYDLKLYAAPNGSTVSYEVTRLDTGAVATGTLSTDLPSNTTFLTYGQYINNGGTAAAAAMDFFHVYIETDY